MSERAVSAVWIPSLSEAEAVRVTHGSSVLTVELFALGMVVSSVAVLTRDHKRFVIFTDCLTLDLWIYEDQTSGEKSLRL